MLHKMCKRNHKRIFDVQLKEYLTRSNIIFNFQESKTLKRFIYDFTQYAIKLDQTILNLYTL